jgi:1-acyl-sn-glycerol-3-phosphate acyltransferase
LNDPLLADAIAGAARFVTGAQVTWTAGTPQPRQTIFFANHTSHLDFVTLWASLPRWLRSQTRPVAAQDYWDRGVRRKLAVDVFNAILVPRREHGLADADPAAAVKTIDRIAGEMGDAYSLIIFPEGTRGDGSDVAPFKSGLYHLAHQKPGVQLVPAYIENLNRILPKGEFLPVPFISRITFGQAFFLDATESKSAFLTRAHDAVSGLKHP